MTILSWMLLHSLPLLVAIEDETAVVAKRKRMTNHGGVALACVRCENGYSVALLSHPLAEPISKEQLDAVKDQLLSEDNAELRHSVFSAYLEEHERSANMIGAFAREKGLKLDASPGEIVDYLDKLDDDEIDIEMTPEMLASVSGGSVFKAMAGSDTCWQQKRAAGEKFTVKDRQRGY